MAIQTDNLTTQLVTNLETVKTQASSEPVIELHKETFPHIYKLESSKDISKGVIVISPGLCTRQLHLVKPFIGYQLAKRGFTVYSLNTLDLQDYGLNHRDPFERLDLTLKAYELINELHPNEKIISLGHSLGCIDLLRTQPSGIEASIFISPGFKGDKRRFGPKKFLEYFLSFLSDKELQLSPHGNKVKPELVDFKTDYIHPKFIWNLQAYAHGLENSHHWPAKKPCLVWLGSKETSDGVMEMRQPLRWVKIMRELNPKVKFILDVDAGHEPGWKDPLHSETLAAQIDEWLDKNLF
ncbi:MAG: hypothetical protein SFU25_10255 [Candidatus Caenarcaniphilales bacterium]|nr:hypothetical protein [Candidatus Caenarcaniphilales bacterium]